MLKDSKAEELEAKGLYRRAATRWGELMRQCHDERQREEIKARIDACTEKARRPPVKEGNFGGLRKAIDETENRMGIAQSRVEPFRLRSRKNNYAQ